MKEIESLSKEISAAWTTLETEYPLLGKACTVHRTTRGQPMNFAFMPSLIEFYSDFPNIDGADLCKATQTGGSECLIQLGLHNAGRRGRIVAYVLPTHSLRNRFVQRRIQPLINEVPEYRMMSGGYQSHDNGKKKGAENLSVREFGEGAMLFLGSNSVNDFIEFSADTLIIDELEQCVPANLAKAQDRIRMSPYPQTFKVANPTIANHGICKLFDKGDGRLYHWPCGHCGERQPMDFFSAVVHQDDNGDWVPRDKARWTHLRLNNGKGPDLRPVCRKCGKPFNRDATGSAWVAERPGKRRSYRMSRLDVLSDRVFDIYKEFEDASDDEDRIQAFYAGALGLGYEPQGMSLNAGHLDKVSTGRKIDYYGGQDYVNETVVMGIDVGKKLNVQIGLSRRDDDGNPMLEVVHLSEQKGLDDLKRLILEFHVNHVVIDALPEGRMVKQLQEWSVHHTSAHVFACRFFPTDRLGRQKFGMKVNWPEMTVNVDRTQVIDEHVQSILQQRIIFPSDSFSCYATWAKQMTAPKRIWNDKKGLFYWHEGSARDDAHFCSVYTIVALELSKQGGGFLQF